MKEAIEKVLKRHAFPLKVLISFGLLVYCARFIDVEQLRKLEVQWVWIAIAWALVLIDYVIGAIRFKALADVVSRLSISTHIKYYFWSGFFNAALPSSIGGDAMRMIWLRGHGVPTKAAVSLVFFERVLGLLTLILIAVFGMLMVEIPSALQALITALWLWSGVGLFAALALILILKESQLIQKPLQTTSKVFMQLGLAKCAVILGLSLFYQIITVTITIFVAKSIGLELSAAVWFFTVPLVWLLTVLPISVGGLGVREIGFVFLLGAFGQYQEQAIVLGLLSFLVYLLGGLVGGAWYVYGSRGAGK